MKVLAASALFLLIAAPASAQLARVQRHGRLPQRVHHRSRRPEARAPGGHVAEGEGPELHLHYTVANHVKLRDWFGRILVPRRQRALLRGQRKMLGPGISSSC